MDVISRINELLDSGQSFCLATVMESPNTNIKATMKFIVHADGTLESGSETEQLAHQVYETARTVFYEKKCRLVELVDGTRLF